MVPHLITALTGPINELEQRILESMPAVERWFRLEWMEHTPPFYCSVDIRNAGFKLAPRHQPVPGGWNNLTPEMLPLAVQAAMAAIEKICPKPRTCWWCRRTRSTFYLSNIAQLQKIFRMAGLNVRVGSIDPDIKKATTVELPGGDTVTLEPVVRSKRLGLKNFDPCTILLNNDLTAGPPGILEDLHEQYLLPPLHAGWSVRRKSRHFQSYEEVAKRFGKMLGIDSWLVNPMFNRCGELDFFKEEGMDCLRTNVDALLTRIRKKYKEYGINEKPFVIVKDDHGTHGMGIMTVRDVKDLGLLRERPKNKPPVGKTGQAITDVIIQEGVLRRADQRRRGRAGGLPDGPLRGGRLLPRPRRARLRREPQCARLHLRAAGFAESTRPSPAEAGRQRAQPLLHVRDRPAGHAGGQLRAGSDRPDAESYD